MKEPRFLQGHNRTNLEMTPACGRNKEMQHSVGSVDRILAGVVSGWSSKKAGDGDVSVGSVWEVRGKSMESACARDKTNRVQTESTLEPGD